MDLAYGWPFGDSFCAQNHPYCLGLAFVPYKCRDRANSPVFSFSSQSWKCEEKVVLYRLLLPKLHWGFCIPMMSWSLLERCKWGLAFLQVLYIFISWDFAPLFPNVWLFPYAQLCHAPHIGLKYLRLLLMKWDCTCSVFLLRALAFILVLLSFILVFSQLFPPFFFPLLFNKKILCVTMLPFSFLRNLCWCTQGLERFWSCCGEGWDKLGQVMFS